MIGWHSDSQQDILIALLQDFPAYDALHSSSDLTAAACGGPPFCWRRCAPGIRTARIVLVGDGGYSAVELVACCQRLRVKLVSRLRLDAQLYAFASEQPAHKRGPKPKKGERLPSLAAVFAAPKTVWCRAEIGWYGGQVKPIEYCTGVCL